MAGRFLLPPMYVFPETGDRMYQKSNDKIVIIMKGILETVASVVERLSLSSAEKKRLKQELETALLENECQRVEMQARVVGEEARFEDLFSGFDIFGNAFVLNLLITLKVIAWSLLFVIPGIVAAYRYSMATYIMAENPGMQATEAIERSKALMDGRKGDLFCLDLSFIGWALLATLTAGIGYLWLTPYMTVSRAAFYRSLPRSMGDRAPNGWQPNPGPQPGGDWYSQN